MYFSIPWWVSQCVIVFHQRIPCFVGVLDPKHWLTRLPYNVFHGPEASASGTVKQVKSDTLG